MPIYRSQNHIPHRNFGFPTNIIFRKEKIFEPATKSINATEFLKRMKKPLDAYTNNLISDESDSEDWDNLGRKLRKVIKDCE